MKRCHHRRRRRRSPPPRSSSGNARRAADGREYRKACARRLNGHGRRPCRGPQHGGPLATLTLPVADGSVFPLEYSVTRGDLREGLPDYIWEAEDIYVKADLTAPSGKEFAVGRGKSKFKDNEHQISYVLLE